MLKQVLTLTAEDIKKLASWPMVTGALRDGHKLPQADIGDTFVHARDNTMLVRSAWINGLAAGVKAATVVPENPNRAQPLPAIQACIMVFDNDTGELSALLDGTEVTGWKTAGDSALGCDLLARKDAEVFLMVGAGAMAEPLVRAHLSVRPDLKKIILWNRSRPRVVALADRLSDLSQDIEIAGDLDAAIPEADIISCATMSKEPVLEGRLVSPGTHVDLVGAYKADMREADDELHRRGVWFVDSRDTTVDHIGEISIPLAKDLIGTDAIQGDLYALVAGKAGRQGREEITVFKNGGGAHLDIMVSVALVDAAKKAS